MPTQREMSSKERNIQSYCNSKKKKKQEIEYIQRDGRKSIIHDVQPA